LDQMDEGVVLPEYYQVSDYELSGQQFKLGLALRVGPRFGLAATMTPKSTMDITGTMITRRDAYRNTPMDSTFVLLDGERDLPSEWRFGISYYPQNITRTVFNLDVEAVNYEEIDKAMDNVYNLYAGVEHHITHRMPLRLGFQAVNSYLYETGFETDDEGNQIALVQANKILTPMITAGSSVEVARNVSLDLGFGYGFREYEALDLFGDAYYNDKIYTGSSSYTLWPTSYIDLQNRGWDNPDKVKENFITLNAGISIGW